MLRKLAVRETSPSSGPFLKVNHKFPALARKRLFFRKASFAPQDGTGLSRLFAALRLAEAGAGALTQEADKRSGSFRELRLTVAILSFLNLVSAVIMYSQRTFAVLWTPLRFPCDTLVY